MKTFLRGAERSAEELSAWAAGVFSVVIMICIAQACGGISDGIRLPGSLPEISKAADYIS